MFYFYYWLSFKCSWSFFETLLLSIFFIFGFSVFFSNFVSFCGKIYPFFLNFEIGIAFKNWPFYYLILINSCDLWCFNILLLPNSLLHSLQIIFLCLPIFLFFTTGVTTGVTKQSTSFKTSVGSYSVFKD